VDFNPLQIIIADFYFGFQSNADYPFQIRWFKKDRPSLWLFVLCLWLLSVRLKSDLYKSPEPLALGWKIL
jgi:hypothetical protein